MIINVPEEKEEGYYAKLNVGIGFSKMWNSLQEKSDYGRGKSERGYQLVAKTMAGNIARAIGADANLAEALTMCKGSYFPSYGKAGKKVILHYLRDRQIQISEQEFARSFVEFDMQKSGLIISKKFHQMLGQLFGNETDVPIEVQIARVCSKTMEDIKNVEDFSKIDKVNLIYKVSQDVEQESKKAGKPVESPKLSELVSTIDIPALVIGKREKESIYEKLDKFRNLNMDEPMKGVYEYMSTGLEI